MLNAITAIALAAAAQAPAAVAADRWNLDIAPAKCTLTHNFSRPRAATLSISTQVGTDDYMLTIADHDLRRMQEGIPREATLKVDRRTRARTYVDYFPGRAPFAREAVIAGLGGEVIDAIGQGRELSIGSSGGNSRPLPLPNAAEAVAALRGCEADQLIAWGADASQFEPGGRQPRVGDRMALVPQSVLRRIRFPAVPIEPLHYLVLSDSGVVERCAAVFGIPNSNFEEVVCASLMGRRIGEPARNPAGTPVRGVVALTPAIVRTAVSIGR